MSNIEFTEQEKTILRVMFQNMNNVIESCGGYINVCDMGFGRNDLYYMFEKLHIGDDWET